MPRILVIDDDTAVCTVIKTVLEREGFDVVVAEDGRSGIAAVENSRFDVILIDILMPGMDGLESIRHLNKRAPDVPVVAMSGFQLRDSAKGAPDFLSMATKLGAASSIQKPFRGRELVQVVEACLARSGPAQRRSPDFDEPTKPCSPPEGLQ
jgi:DNA-binding response OmpR family regulator